MLPPNKAQVLLQSTASLGGPLRAPHKLQTPFSITYNLSLANNPPLHPAILLSSPRSHSAGSHLYSSDSNSDFVLHPLLLSQIPPLSFIRIASLSPLPILPTSAGYTPLLPSLTPQPSQPQNSSFPAHLASRLSTPSKIYLPHSRPRAPAHLLVGSTLTARHGTRIQYRNTRSPGAEGACVASRKDPAEFQGPRSPGPVAWCSIWGTVVYFDLQLLLSAPVARPNRQGPCRGYPLVPGVSSSAPPLAPSPDTGLDPGCLLSPSCPVPRARNPDRSAWALALASACLRARPRLCICCQKKAGGSRASGQGCSGQWVSSPGGSSPSSSGPGRSGARHPLPEPRASGLWAAVTKLHKPFRSLTQAPKQATVHSKPRPSSAPKRDLPLRAHSPKVTTLVLEPQEAPGAPPLNPTSPARPPDLRSPETL